MKKFLAITTSIMFLNSCYTYTTIPISKTMDTWKGATEHQIILTFGAPSSTTSDGAGGKILVYSQEQSITYYNRLYTNSGITSSNTYKDNLFMQFFIDSTGIVYNWKTNYPDKVIKKSDTKKTDIVIGSFSAIILIIVLVFGSQ